MLNHRMIAFLAATVIIVLLGFLGVIYRNNKKKIHQKVRKEINKEKRRQKKQAK